ncbi:MAG: YkgJ family cysteine cluster protein [Candidatus Gastranaerophilaceae bacterium]
MFEIIKFLFQKVTSSKYVVTGKCKKCGMCCKNIVFYVGKRAVCEEKEFLNMQEFDKRYKNFEINGKGEKGELLFKCKSLLENGLCGAYKFRSLNCRLYPKINQKFVYNGGETLDGCGYKFSITKRFKEYIDSK